MVVVSQTMRCVAVGPLRCWMTETTVWLYCLLVMKVDGSVAGTEVEDTKWPVCVEVDSGSGKARNEGGPVMMPPGGGSVRARP